MSVFLDTSNETVCAIAICDRCRVKYPWGDLVPDGNSPGLRVCEECRDVLDPWRLPAPPPDQISLRWVRPDAPLSAGDE